MTKICYSFSSNPYQRKLETDLIHSLRTISKFYSKSDIIVFATPPIEERAINRVKKYAEVIVKSEHLLDERPVYGGTDNPVYTDKYHLTEIEDEQVIFLDCDTELQTDPAVFFENNVDVKGRCDHPSYKDMWPFYLKHFNLPSNTKYFATDVLLFNNYAHKKIKSLLEYYAGRLMKEDFQKEWKQDRLFDLTILSLASANLNTQYFPEYDNSWTDISFDNGNGVHARDNAPILHGACRKFWGANQINIELIEDSNLRESLKTKIPLKQFYERFIAGLIVEIEEEFPDYQIVPNLSNKLLEVRVKNAKVTRSIAKDAIYAYNAGMLPTVLYDDEGSAIKI